MKILVFKQPFPMGNYLLNEVIADHLKEIGNEVYVMEQLNSSSIEKEEAIRIANSITEQVDPDVLYFEMLDQATFQIVEQLKRPLKILTYASKGILEKFTDIVNYKGKWFDKILTNSFGFSEFFKTNNISTIFFPFYPSVIKDEDLKFDQKYNKDCVFLGMGFNRLSSPAYKLERDLFFSETFNYGFSYSIYGSGWKNHKLAKGVLPSDKIGTLYYSAFSAVAIIAESQRQAGMINNRYVEIGSSVCPIITYNYNIEWYGLDKYLFFVENKQHFQKCVADIKNNFRNNEYYDLLDQQRTFFKDKTQEFYQKLESLLI